MSCFSELYTLGNILDIVFSGVVTLSLCVNRNETPQLFTVLPERRTGPVGAAMMASTHIYDMSAVCTLVHVRESLNGFWLADVHIGYTRSV